MKTFDDWVFMDTFSQAPPATPAVDPDWLNLAATPPAQRIIEVPKLNDIASTSKNQSLQLLFLPYTDAGGTALFGDIRNIAQQIDVELLGVIPDRNGTERVCHLNTQSPYFGGWPFIIGLDGQKQGTVNGIKLLPRILGWGTAQATVVRYDMFYRLL